MEKNPHTYHIAPMEGMTTFPMRVLLNMTSVPDGATTPFLRVTKTFPEYALPPSFIPELALLPPMGSYQTIPQFLSCDPDSFLRACELIPLDRVPFIELNCGCPTPNAAGRTAGSGILKHPDEFLRMIDDLCQKLGNKRLAIKMRVGFQDPAEFPALLAVADLPLARLTIHGRTRQERYTGLSRWNLIDLASKRCKAPVFGSGDILGKHSYHQRHTTAPQVHGFFLGRGFLQNPWIISELKADEVIKISRATLILALSSFGLINELAHAMPTKLLGHIAEGRIGRHCGIDEDAWMASVHTLMNAANLPATVISRELPLPSLQLSRLSFSRVRTLWTYLRKALPPEYAHRRILKAKSMNEFIGEIWHSGAEDFRICGEREFI